MVALKVVEGDDTGAFRPDDKISRSEVTKMVVAALNQTGTAESSKGATAFSDVAADHWASGFINVGSNASGFINGMGDGTFNPDGNVTYDQLVKMLVASCGYNMMAMQRGGYPTGYMSIANQNGMTKGVSASGTDELTRAQVAVLVDNAMKMPILDTTTWSVTNPEYAIMDRPQDREYKTLLTEKHNAYVVEGRVTATNKTTSGSLDADKIRFNIESADRFDDEYDIKKRDVETHINDQEMYIGDTKAADYLQIYASAIVQKNDDDDYVMLSIVPSGKSSQVVRAIGAFDDENSNYNGTGTVAEELIDRNALYFYDTDAKTGTAKTYKLSEETPVELYVNGVNVEWTADNVDKYIINNTSGDVTLLDVPTDTSSSTDGKYECVFVTYYLSATVNTVAGAANRVSFNNQFNGVKHIELDDEKVEDGDLTYHITLDGKEIAPADLQEDDVVAIAYDVTAADMSVSTFYDIIVTRGTVEGMVSTLDDSLGYHIGDNYYKPETFDGSSDKTLEVGTTYTLWVDAFGRIVASEEAASTKKMAILDNLYTTSDGETIKVKVVLQDNTTAEYDLKTKADANMICNIIAGEAMDSTSTSNYSAGRYANDTKADIQKRVVEYKLNSSNELTINDVASPVEMKGTFKSNSSKIGGKTINSEAKIIDASDYRDDIKDLDTFSISGFENDGEYVAYGFDKASDNSYRFVIVTEGVSNYTDDTQVAIFNKELVTTDANGDAVKAIEVYFDGELKTYEVDDEVCASNESLGHTLGDVLLLKKNGDDQISQIDVVFDNNLSTSYSAFKDVVMEAMKGGNTADMFKLPDEWDITKKTDTEVTLAFGPISNKNTNSVSLATLESDGTSLSSKDKDYDLNSDTKVYVFEYKNKSGNSRLYAGSTGDIIRSTGFKTSDETIDWGSNDVYANFAFIKAVDGEAAQVLVVLCDE